MDPNQSGARTRSQRPSRHHSESDPPGRRVRGAAYPSRSASLAEFRSQNIPPPPTPPTPPPRRSRSSSTRGGSRTPTVRTRGSFSSMKSSMSNAELGDMKHQVMVNHLYHQQCTNLWVAEGAGETEGCILRKDQGEYTTCPRSLQDSRLLESMRSLNVQASHTIASNTEPPIADQHLERHDPEFQNDQDLHGMRPRRLRSTPQEWTPHPVGSLHERTGLVQQGTMRRFRRIRRSLGHLGR